MLEFEFPTVKVQEGAHRLRERLMFKVVSHVVETMAKAGPTVAAKDWKKHWHVERLLKLRPHFEHACFVISRPDHERYPYDVRLAFTLRTAELHWATVKLEGMQLSTMLSRSQCLARDIRTLSRKSFKTLTTALMYDRRQYSRDDEEAADFLNADFG